MTVTSGLRLTTLPSILLFLALCQAPPQALAHTSGLGMVLIDVHPEHIRWGIRLDAALLDETLALDQDHDSVITRSEIDARIDPITRYAEEHLRLTTDGVSCDEFVWHDYDVDDPERAHIVDATGELRCPQPLGVIVLTNTILLDVSPGYRQLAYVRTRGGRLEATFSREQPTITVPIAAPYISPPGRAEPGSAPDHTPTVAPTADTQGAPTSMARIQRFVRLGVEHIVPKGIDHILFIIGLIVATRRLGQLLAIVTAFTLAHSVTLGLAAFDVIRIPISTAEALIAASLVWVGVENLITTPRRRWLLAALFGLVHGVGFSSVLSDLVQGIESTTLERTQALLGFNVGVEVGQLAVVLAIYPLLLLAKRRNRERWVRVPASLTISLFGLLWFLERTGLV